MRTKILISFVPLSVQVAEERSGSWVPTLRSAGRVLPCPEAGRTRPHPELLSLQFYQTYAPQPGFSPAPEPTSSGAAFWEVRTHLGPKPLSDLPPAPAERYPGRAIRGHPPTSEISSPSASPYSVQNAALRGVFAEAITGRSQPGQTPRPEAGR